MDYYSQLLSLIPEKELEEKISQKIEEFHGYLTREAAVTLLAKENKIYKEQKVFLKLNAIDPNSKDINLKAKVIQIDPLIQYPSGKKSKKAIIKDETKEMPFVLWEKDIPLFNKLRLNDEIEITRAYEKNGRIGLRYGGKIIVSKKKNFTPLNELQNNENEKHNIRAFVSEKINNKELKISNGDSECNLQIIQGQDRFSQIEKGDELIIENAHFKNNSLIIDSKTRILSRRPKDIMIGKVESISLESGELIVTLKNKETKKLPLKAQDIYTFLNIKRSDNLSLETILKLKKDLYLQKQIFIKFKDGILKEVSILG